MTENAKEARRAYRRKWAKEHPEKIKQYQERYWNKLGEKAAKHPERARNGCDRNI